jgi:hypothetical protein
VLRLSTTFGYSGNVDLSKTAAAVGSIATSTLSGLRFIRISNVNNPDLSWEELSQLDIKASFSSRANRLAGSVSYFVKRGKNLYGLTPYDYTGWAGRVELTKNVADMKGYGVDLELHGLNIKGKDFQWNTDLYGNYNRDETVDYFRRTGSDLSALLTAGSRITPVVGLPLYAISAYKWGGLSSSGQAQGYLNGKLSTDYSAMLSEARLTANNLVYIGPASPVWFGSLNNTFSYKNLSLSLNISYRLGYYFRKSSVSYASMVSSGSSHADYALRWQKAGDELHTDVPAYVYPGNGNADGFYASSEVNVVKGDNIRLENVNLLYNIPAGAWKVPFRSLQVSLGVQNAGIIWRANRLGLDPEYENKVRPKGLFNFGFRGRF